MAGAGEGGATMASLTGSNRIGDCKGILAGTAVWKASEGTAH